MAQLQCQLCGAPVTIAEPLPRDAECGSCKHDLRCCRNCRHYDPAYNNSCRETMADPVEDKTRRNFCDYFYSTRAAFTAGTGDTRTNEARAKLESLFGGRPAPAGPGASAKDKLDALFGAGPERDRESEARKKLEGLFEKPDQASDDRS